MSSTDYRSIFERKYEKQDPWHSQESVFEKERLSRCFHLISKKENINLLDIGCGEGVFITKFSELGKDVCGIDISKTALLRSNSKLKKAHFSISDARFIPFKDESFDVICCLEVLYYFPAKDRLDVLREISRLLKPNGVLLISVRVKEGKSLTGEPFFEYDQFINILRENFSIKIALPVAVISVSWAPRVIFNVWLKLAEFVPTALAKRLSIQIVVFATK